MLEIHLTPGIQLACNPIKCRLPSIKIGPQTLMISSYFFTQPDTTNLIHLSSGSMERFNDISLRVRGGYIEFDPETFQVRNGVIHLCG